MLLGLVSNCWRMQLDGGATLDGLIEEAQRQGLCAIELRQGCLGEYEDRQTLLPDAPALAALARRFAGVKLSLAVACPFFDPAAELNKDLLQAGIDAAASLAPTGEPHLRLVDVSTSAAAAEKADLAAVAGRLAVLAANLAALGGCLSLENGKQSWAGTTRLLHAVGDQLKPRSAAIRLCYDPANIPAIDQPQVARRVLDDLATINLGIVHFKQLAHGVAQPAVAAGDIDWAAQLQALRQLSFAGPALFEIPAGEDTGRNLASSLCYIRGLVAQG